MKYKFVIGGDDTDFYQVSYSDIEKCDEAVYLTKVLQTNSRIVNKIYSHHFGKTLNRYIQLPFKSVWNRLYLRNKFDKNENICFVLFSYYVNFIQYGLLDTIRKTYPNCKIVCFYQDIASVKRAVSPENISKYFDLVLSFDHKDCETYGWTYYPLVYSCTHVDDDMDIPESDVYFVGKAKNRLDQIIAVYQKFKDAGFRCDFHIVGVPEDNRIMADEIDYCEQMPYDKNLKHIKKTKCMLEIMQQGGHGYTLRYCEAIAHGKNLITNNPEIKDAPFYSSQFISVFSSVEDINVNFLRNCKQHVDYHYKEKLSPLKMLEFIDDYFVKKEDEI